MKKIKIFLASSEDLKDEALELSDLVEHLNLILENQDIHIYLDKWEFLDNERGAGEQGIWYYYESKLDQNDILIAVFGRELGSFSEKELKQAFNRLHKEGINPEKIYVYFKSLGGLKEDLRVFRDTFSDNFGQIAALFNDTNILKNEFLLQFQVFQNCKFKNAFPIKIKDSKVTLNGEDLAIDFSSLPYVSNVSRLNVMKAELENIELLMECLSPEDKLYSENAQKKNKLQEEKEKLESKLWETAIKIEEFKEYPISDKLKRAIKLFENGEIERILEIIDSDEIKEAARQNLRKIQDGKRQKEEGASLIIEGNNLLIEGLEGLKNNIRELQLAVQAEEINMSEGWGERVLDHHENIIRYTKEIYGSISPEYIKELTYAGEKNRLLSKFSNALDLYLKALTISLEEYGENHYLTLFLYNNIAPVYRTIGDLNKALEFQQKVITSDFIEDESVFAFLMNYANISITYNELGRPEDALKYALKALEMEKVAYGENSLDVAYSYNNLAYIYLDLNEIDKALEYGKLAVNILLKNNGEKDGDTATALDTLGQIWRIKGDEEMALKNISRALKIRREIFGRYHLDVYDSNINMGLIAFEKEHFQTALEYYLDALHIIQEINPEDILEIAQIYERIGKTYGCLMHFKESVEFLLKSVDLKKIKLGENNMDIAELYSKISFMCGLGEEYKEALHYGEKSYHIYKDILGENNVTTLKSYKKLGKLHEKKGDACYYDNDCKNSLKAYLKALELFRELYGETDEEVAIIYQKLSRAYLENQEFENGIFHIKKAIGIWERINDKEKLASCLKTLSQIYFESGEIEMSKLKLREALSIVDDIDKKEELKNILDQLDQFNND